MKSEILANMLFIPYPLLEIQTTILGVGKGSPAASLRAQ